MSRAVADAKVLIYLARLGDLRTLDDLFDTVSVPEPVHEETVDRGRNEGYPDAMSVADAVDSLLELDDIEGEADERATELQETANLGTGETAAIALAAERDAHCLTDDHAVCRTAESLDVTVCGTIYVLLRALKRDVVSLQEFEQRLEVLNEAGFRMSAGLYQQALDAAEELVE